MTETELTERRKFAALNNIDVDSLGKELASVIPEIRLDFENTDYYSYSNVIRKETVQVNVKLNDQYEKIKKILEEACANKPGELIERIKEKTTPVGLEELFSVYVQEIELARSKLSQGTKKLENEAETAFETAKYAFVGREEKKNVYIRAVIALYKAKARADCLTCMAYIYGEAKKLLERPKNQNFEN